MKNASAPKGRIKQKQQTRVDILNAAKTLMQKEQKITLEDVATEANISRATMYRYFSNMDLLFMEATLDIQHKSPDQIFEEVKDLPMIDRILHIQSHYNEYAQKNEIVFRRYLSAVISESITSKDQLRGARRTKTLHKALKPFKSNLTNDTYNKLVNISTVLMGIDPLITCKDVCNLTNEEAKNTLKWALELIIAGIPVKE